ncbi:MAG: hypothetical protein JWM95_448 [Gemmatimonadetes bacterium]|nr:hypothetical protein [Gemmatimonadota bacterium]
MLEWPLSTQVAAAGLALGLAANIAVVTRLGQRHATVAASPSLPPVPQIVIHSPYDDLLVRSATSRSPFDMDIPASAVAHGLSAVPPVTQPAAQPRLIGTVVQGRDSGFVIVEMPDVGMRLVRVGELAGQLRLKAVRSGQAEFQDTHGATVLLKAPLPSDVHP